LLNDFPFELLPFSQGLPFEPVIQFIAISQLLPSYPLKQLHLQFPIFPVTFPEFWQVWLAFVQGAGF